MKERDIKNIFNTTRSISLTEVERAGMRSLLEQKITVPKKVTVTDFVVSLKSKYMRMHWAYVYAPVVATLVLFVGGGFSLAAQDALPGQFLYSIKTNFNEEVAGLFSANPKAKAELQSRLAERRLLEAQRLAVTGKLTPESSRILEEKLAVHVSSVNKQVESLKSTNEVREAVEASSQLEQTLRSQEKILTVLNEEDEVKDMVSVVRAALVMVSEENEELAVDVANDEGESEELAVSVADKKAQAQQEYRRVQALLVDAQERAATSTTEILQEQSVVIDSLIKEGDAHIAAGSFNKALLQFQKALRFSSEIILEAKKEKEIDREEVEIPEVIEEGEAATTTPEEVVSTTSDPII